MPNLVPITPKSLAEHQPHIGDARTEELLRLAEPLRGARVLHINATAYGGGVAEILSSFIPLLCDLGIEAEWRVMDATAEFFNVTKNMHNAMQGMYIPWTTAMADTWRQINRANAEELKDQYDFVYIHDPQPAGMLHFVRQRDPEALGAHWIWRCHLDTTEALPEVWSFLKSYVQEYDALVYTMKDYLKERVKGPRLAIIPPAIDPTSMKNSAISGEIINDVLSRYDIDPNRPTIAQISRFDPWKDPLGVVDVYRILKERHPELQLLMVASMANDDPEAWSYYERIVRKAGEDFDIHILTNLNGVGNLEVNTFQRAPDVILQKSVREGFGLVVSEALWKGKAFVGSNAGGIPLQLDHGKAGRIANTTEEFAAEIDALLSDAATRDELGHAGMEHVRENFLITRLLRDHLQLMNSWGKKGSTGGNGKTGRTQRGASTKPAASGRRRNA
ncbi:MAG: glycosyltransferase [Dehalococcoidia bacterium]